MNTYKIHRVVRTQTPKGLNYVTDRWTVKKVTDEKGRNPTLKDKDYTKSEAIKAGRKIAKENRPSELLITNTDDEVHKTITYD